MNKQSLIYIKHIAILLIVLSCLYFTKLYNYLLFHSITEVFSIVISCGIFMFAWNSRQFLKDYFVFIGIAYLFVGIADLIHTLAYPGMGIFKGHGTNLTVQLWIISRYIESISLLLAPLIAFKKLRYNFVFPGYILVILLSFASVFYWKIFPVCFVEGIGLSLFKIISEYIISLFLLVSIFFLYRKRSDFDPDTFKLLVASIIITIFSEMAFTLYTHVFAFFNMLGHFLKIISFYLIYRAIIENGIVKPYALILRDIKQNNESLSKEITERKHAEEQVHKLSRAVEQSSSTVIITDSKGTIEYVNPKFTQLTCYTPEEAIGQDPSIMKSGKTPPEVYKELWKTIKSGNEWRGELYNMKKNGEFYWEYASISPVKDTEGTITHFIAVKEDITERKKMEDIIKRSLKEKEVLLKEIHHRVKNNMQVITSILNLQAGQVKDKNLKDIFKECQNRIKSMSYIHEELYKKDNLAMIDFSEYTENLANNILKSYSIHTGRISLKTNVDNVFLDIDKAVPCSLIINELLTNSLKYAFPTLLPDGKDGLENNAQKEGKGEILISFNSDDDKYTLIFSDNGVGIPKDLDIGNTNTLGMVLINTLTLQLGGSIELDRSKGTEFKIVFEV